MVRWKSRFGYALAACGVSLFVVPILALILSFFGADSGRGMSVTLQSVFEMIALTGLPAGLAAAICWPYKTPRTKKRMALAGILTVFVAFILIGLIFGFREAGFDAPLVVIGSIPVMLVFGSLFTLGIPYLLGALASLPFADTSP